MAWDWWDDLLWGKDREYTNPFGIGQKHNPSYQSKLPQNKQTQSYRQREANKAKLKESSTNSYKANNPLAGHRGPYTPEPKQEANQVVDPGVANQGVNEALLEGYLSQIQERLAASKAVAPNITLNTKPIDQAKASSVAALAQALDVATKSIGTARANTNTSYNNAKAETKGAYDAIEGRSRKEGTKAAKDSGKAVSDELAKAASVAMAGINQNLTESDDLLAAASKNLGGNNAALKEIDQKVDPYNSTETVRNNISQNYQDQAGNAARQTSRDVQAAGRYADTIGTDGASAISNLMAELAGRNNQFDRDLVDVKNTHAGNLANLNSTYADKLMQAQLAQQQEQNSVNQAAWQTNINNDNAALQGMLDLINSESKARNEQAMETLKFNQQNSNSGAKNAQRMEEILTRALVGHTDKNSLSTEDIKQMLAMLQAG